jgi:hypothetical protein
MGMMVILLLGVLLGQFVGCSAQAGFCCLLRAAVFTGTLKCKHQQQLVQYRLAEVSKMGCNERLTAEVSLLVVNVVGRQPVLCFL